MEAKPLAPVELRQQYLVKFWRVDSIVMPEDFGISHVLRLRQDRRERRVNRLVALHDELILVDLLSDVLNALRSENWHDFMILVDDTESFRNVARKDVGNDVTHDVAFGEHLSLLPIIASLHDILNLALSATKINADTVLV